MAKKQFKAESKRLLEMMINSIYTHKEIFLREIISNASDAIDKLCYLSLTDENVGMSRSDFRIRLTPDKTRRTLTVSDNGIGMSKEDMEQNLGIIARSGSLRFKNEMDGEIKDEDIDIIGQFGVGFYSAFMVADKVTVISRAYGAETAFRWESTGADGYTVTECEKTDVGTDVIMHMKPDGEEEDYSQYLDTWKLRQLIKKYSDYVRWPIRMDIEKTEQKETGEKNEDGTPKTETVTVTEEQTINSMVPIWQRAKIEVSDDDCKAFYKEKFHDTENPAAIIRVNAEGLVSYKSLLFVPKVVPFDFYSRDFEPGLQLYSSGVMIMERCADLLPECFRFVRGVVDSPDLSLNISRELLQHDRQLRVIASNLEKKIRAELLRVMNDDPDVYEQFWMSFGRQIKYSFVSDYGAKKDLLTDLLLFWSSENEELVPLREYVKAMPENQKSIYYVCADSVRMAAQLPQTEQVRRQGFEMLYLIDEYDEFVIKMLGEFEGKPFCDVASDDLGFEDEQAKQETEKKQEESRELLDFMKQVLIGRVSDVRLSHKLVSHAVCLSTDGEVTLEMEKYFASLPNEEAHRIKAKRVFELNDDHPAFKALEEAFAADRDKAEKLTLILHDQALLIAGLPIEDPSRYSELVCSLF